MDKESVISFFNRCAPSWDKDLVRNEPAIARILDNGGVRAGVSVLDVACGTGVLLPDYLARGVSSVTGVDISPEMIRIAREKAARLADGNGGAVHFLCADIETVRLPQRYDCVMVYNAFPHFPEPERLLRVLAGWVKPGGRLSVAHGMSRAQLTAHHSGSASKISRGLPEAEALAAMMAPYLAVDVVISDEQMYQVAGTRRTETEEAAVK